MEGWGQRGGGTSATNDTTAADGGEGGEERDGGREVGRAAVRLKSEKKRHEGGDEEY